MGAAVQVLKDMAGISGNSLLCTDAIRDFFQYRWFFLGSLLCSTPVFRMTKKMITRRSQALGTAAEWLAIPIYLFLLIWSVSYIMMGSHNPFIYFNF